MQTLRKPELPRTGKFYTRVFVLSLHVKRVCEQRWNCKIEQLQLYARIESRESSSFEFIGSHRLQVETEEGLY